MDVQVVWVDAESMRLQREAASAFVFFTVLLVVVGACALHFSRAVPFAWPTRQVYSGGVAAAFETLITQRMSEEMYLNAIDDELMHPKQPSGCAMRCLMFAPLTARQPDSRRMSLVSALSATLLKEEHSRRCSECGSGATSPRKQTCAVEVLAAVISAARHSNGRRSPSSHSVSSRSLSRENSGSKSPCRGTPHAALTSATTDAAWQSRGLARSARSTSL